MFKVQRFTAEDEEDEGSSGREDQSNNILNKVLQRAKARVSAKRPRVWLGGDGGVQRQAGSGEVPLERVGGAKSADLRGVSEVRSSGKGVSRGRQRLTPADSNNDLGRNAATAATGSGQEASSEEEEEEDEEEDDDDEDEALGKDSNGERDSSSGEGSDSEAEASGEVKDAEMPLGQPMQPEPEVFPAVGDSREEHKAGGQGLRPMEEVAEEWGLDPTLAETLREEGIKHFFPIQVRVVPDIVATERHSHVQSRDICVSAPTGSGKTLVFVLGVLQALIRRRVVRLRALVLLPSRDLAMQVHAVFKRYARGTGLRVGLAIGQTNFLEEQLSLVGASALEGNPVATARASFLRAQGLQMGPDPKNSSLNMGWDGWSGGASPAGGSSEVDIIVATPGRLLDHLAQTPGFTLQHLRYLVIDEADRLLNQSYQGWVGKVIKAAYRKEPGRASPLYEGRPGSCENPRLAADDHSGQQQQLRRHGVFAGTGKRPRGGGAPPPLRRYPLSAVLLDPVTMRGRPLAGGERVRGPTVSTPPLRKLLFSATLTNNPQKLAGLDVVNPLVYTAREVSHAPVGAAERAGGATTGRERHEDGVQRRPSQETRRSNLDEIGLAAGVGGRAEGRFSTPTTLEEMYTVCDPKSKPLVLLSLLREMVGSHAELSVVFTSSVDSTHRLFRLLQLFGGFEGMAAGVAAEAERGGDSAITPNAGINDDGDAYSDGGVAEFSSSLGQRQRSRIVRRARAGAVRVIVCSDGMARGMDLDGVGLVVNYDVPSQAKTYVHRVGRTARAGSRGTAVTITKKGQVKQFLKMRAGVDGKRVRLDSSPAEQSRLLQFAGRYQRCLKDLKEVLEAERKGELDPSAPVTATESY